MMVEVDILLIKQIELKYLSKIKKLLYLLAVDGPKAQMCIKDRSFYSPQTQAVQPTHANRTAHVWRLYVTQLWACLLYTSNIV